MDAWEPHSAFKHQQKRNLWQLLTLCYMFWLITCWRFCWLSPSLQECHRNVWLPRKTCSCSVSESKDNWRLLKDTEERYCKSIEKVNEGTAAMEWILGGECKRGTESSAIGRMATEVVVNTKEELSRKRLFAFLHTMGMKVLSEISRQQSENYQSDTLLHGTRLNCGASCDRTLCRTMLQRLGLSALV